MIRELINSDSFVQWSFVIGSIIFFGGIYVLALISQGGSIPKVSSSKVLKICMVLVPAGILSLVLNFVLAWTINTDFFWNKQENHIVKYSSHSSSEYSQIMNKLKINDFAGLETRYVRCERFSLDIGLSGVTRRSCLKSISLTDSRKIFFRSEAPAPSKDNSPPNYLIDPIQRNNPANPFRHGMPKPLK